MKSIFRYLSFALIAAASLSCTKGNILPEPATGNGSIMLDVSAMPHTRLTADELASVGAEAYVNHIDLFIFGEQADMTTDTYHERITYTSPAQPDTKALGIAKNRFKSAEGYDVYVIANSTIPVSEMASVNAPADLEALSQTDEFIHFTGLDEDNVPGAFLMDAMMADVVLNPAGEEAENKTIDVLLTRAAAKIIVELYEGDAVEFQNPDNEHVYHFRNLPYSTSVLSGNTSFEPQVRSTLPHQVNDYVVWNTASEGTIDGSADGGPNVSITGYVYEYDYHSDPLDKHTSLVVNIPIKMTVTTGSGTEVRDYPVNYYKIPLTNQLKFERNRMYRIRANVKAPGAQSSFDPIEITDLQYNVLAWNTYTPPIEVGGDVNKPKYLQLNTNHVDMYNVDTDATSLQFASSSEIQIKLDRAYYHNFLDNEVTVTDSRIKATSESGALNGNITITSPFENHNNAIRYLEFTVTNQTGQKAQFTVAQYPIIYITNQLGYFSYRTDFQTHYGNYVNGSNYSGISWEGGASGRWDDPIADASSRNNFFASKVIGSSLGNGRYNLNYAWYNNRGNQQTSSVGTMFNNPRMYHIHVTATTSDYTLAKPRLDADGYTEDSEENAMLVSPSFMIASQLGATDIQTNSNIPGGVNQAKQHCKEYVETYYDDNNGNGRWDNGETIHHYDDWRLPTAEEIEIIINHQQNNNNAALYIVLNGSYYYCAYNPDTNGYTKEIGQHGTSGRTHVRCIRDAY